MARISVEDCLKKVDNRFELIHMSAKRVRQLRKGSEPLVVCKNKDIVVALREIARGKIVKGTGEESLLIEDNESPTLEETTDTEGLPEQAEEGAPDEDQGDQEAAPEEKE
ncbi:MAG: DNA-directed RNA polymerase subunit omega [Desulfobacterales bacterium]|nr:DNA-directed RNA polymerase subunit omega [Desulfobacterales bacterium]